MIEEYNRGSEIIRDIVERKKMEKAEKLKTLKDLEVFEDNNPMWNAANKHFEQVIKAEAIKWVKEKEMGITGLYFKDFFNITSEDLK